MINADLEIHYEELLYSNLLGWGNTLLGFVAITMVPLPVIFYKFGARLRASQRFKL